VSGTAPRKNRKPGLTPSLQPRASMTPSLHDDSLRFISSPRPVSASAAASYVADAFTNVGSL
jgi:hypothetical protein